MCSGHGAYTTESGSRIGCPQCLGAGMLRGEWSRCIKCAGLGCYHAVGGTRPTCDACAGKGSLPGKRWTRCVHSACAGRGMPDCKACAGKAALEGNGWTQCFRCRGRGEASVAGGLPTECGGCFGRGILLGRFWVRCPKAQCTAACTSCHGKGGIIDRSAAASCVLSAPMNCCQRPSASCYYSDSDSDSD